MFEKKRSSLQNIENLLDEYRYFNNKERFRQQHEQQQQQQKQKLQTLNISSNAFLSFVGNINGFFNRSSNERNMTRKTRNRQPRIYSAIQSGYCAVCHLNYNYFEEHIQSKQHLKLIGENTNVISLNSFLNDDPFFEFDIDDLEKSCDYFPQLKRKMPRTCRNSISEKVKDSSMSPGSDVGHRLRSRKNINYMTPPLDEDSLTEKSETVKEYRELRSSTRLLAKLTEQINGNGEDVWNSGRPKRSCSNKHRFSSDERLVADNKSYYKVEVLPSKLRSGQQHFNHQQHHHQQQQQQHHYYTRRPETPPNTIEDKVDDKLLFKFKKLRNSELVQLNNEAENFLFPKKDECSDGEDIEGGTTSPTNVTKKEQTSESECGKNEEDESTTQSGSNTIAECATETTKPKKRRRTHAEAFISDNEKYYKFETPGSRLRYQGSYLPSSVTSWTQKSPKNNGDCSITVSVEDEATANNDEETSEIDQHSVKTLPHINLSEYNFSFEKVPEKEQWYRTFQRKDNAEEKYHYFGDYNIWDPFILPYQVGRLPPLDPQDCVQQYNQIKKCLIEPPSSVSTSASCSTPDPSTSNSISSVEGPSFQDEDSKISATMTEVSSSSTLDEFKAVQRRKPIGKPRIQYTTSGKNPRKSPRQHASTLAILSSLLHQRKRKSRSPNKKLPTIEEECDLKSKKKKKIDHFAIARGIEEEISRMCESIEWESCSDGVQFNNSTVDIIDVLNSYDESMAAITIKSPIKRRTVCGKTGRKPGKKKKNRTGWPSINKRMRKPPTHKENGECSGSIDVNNGDFGNSELEDISTDSIKQSESENNNKNDQSSLVDNDNNFDDRVETDDKILTNKVNNNSSENINLDSMQLQPFVRVQKIEVRRGKRKRNTSPKRTNRGQRRMPASPKSPRILRRPRGRWYRER